MIVVIALVAVAYVWIARLIVATSWLPAVVVLTAAAGLARWLLLGDRPAWWWRWLPWLARRNRESQHRRWLDGG